MIYDQIKKLAYKKGVSIYRMEKDLGLPNGMVSKWNTSSPNADNLNKVAKYLEVSMESFLTREKE